jgi:beta-glucosidase
VLWNRVFAEPILLGRYPEGIADLMPGPVNADLAVISSAVDFYGVNYYNPTVIADPSTSAPQESPFTGADLPFATLPVKGYPVTDFGWPVVPEGLGELLVTLAADYGDALPPIYVTESGCAYDDPPDEAGRIRDDRRIDYLDGHLRAVARAVASGVDVRGYLTWSLIDNFEWAEGYTKRFGLVHVDYDTQVRTPRDSYHWYARVIAAHRQQR